MIRHFFSFALLSLFLAACGGSGTPGPSTNSSPQVRAVYALPSDKSANSADLDAISSALSQVKSWYAGELNGATFRTPSSPVLSCSLPNVADAYAVNSWDSLAEDIANCEGVNLADTKSVWLVYADVVHECDTDGALGLPNAQARLSISSRLELDGLRGEAYSDDCGNSYDRSPAYYRGALAQELGRALGLKAPAGCEADATSCDRGALMWEGFSQFPVTYLTNADKAQLQSSDFFE